MKSYIQYSIGVKNNLQAEMVIARLAEWGFDGFEETQEAVLASGEAGVVLEKETASWLSSQEFPFTRELIAGQNWNTLWESNFPPVTVGTFAGIRANFHEPDPNVTYDLIITPKMSFGTGHHATTWQMIDLMKDLPVEGGRVFDFGTGTGVLAILAEKMGAREILAIDHDEWSIANAQENLEANHCKLVKLKQANIPGGMDNCDIVLANINLNIILEYLPILTDMLNQGGYLLLSGLLKGDEVALKAGLKINNVQVVKVTEKNGWLAILGEKEKI